LCSTLEAKLGFTARLVVRLIGLWLVIMIASPNAVHDTYNETTHFNLKLRKEIIV